MTYKKGEIVRTFINWILQVVVGGTVIYKLWEGKTEFAIILCILLYVINIEDALYKILKEKEKSFE